MHSSLVKEIGHELPIDTDDAVFLNSVYRARYPAALGLLPTGEPIEKDAEKALHIARKVREWIGEILRG
jgi:HEPN domain-containing protein